MWSYYYDVGNSFNPQYIEQSIRNITKRCDEVAQMLHYPHEGLERALRWWIGCDLIHHQLDWPSKNIIFGEMFDVLLVDDRLRPRVYVETKTPSPLKPLPGRAGFLKRIPDYPTIAVAILTDGWRWERYDCYYDKNSLHIRDNTIVTLDFQQPMTPDAIRGFFEPISPHNFLEVR
jgi:hypothetical protein